MKLQTKTSALALVVSLFALPVAAQVTDSGQQNAEVLRTNAQISAWATEVVDFV